MYKNVGGLVPVDQGYLISPDLDPDRDGIFRQVEPRPPLLRDHALVEGCAGGL